MSIAVHLDLRDAFLGLQLNLIPSISRLKTPLGVSILYLPQAFF